MASGGHTMPGVELFIQLRIEREARAKAEAVCAEMRSVLVALRSQAWDKAMRARLGDNAEESVIRQVEAELLPQFAEIDQALSIDAGKGWRSQKQIEELAEKFESIAPVNGPAGDGLLMAAGYLRDLLK